MRRLLASGLVLACACSKPVAPVPLAPPAPTVVAPPPVPTPAPPPSGAIHSSWSARKLAAHALERLAYGPRPGDVDAVAAAGVEAWIRRQMKPSTIADEVTDAELRELPTLAMSPAGLRAAYPRPNNPNKKAGVDGGGAAVPVGPSTLSTPNAAAPPAMSPADHRPVEIERELAAQKIVRAVTSERQLQEVLVDFWFNHFNVFADKGADKWLVGPYERDVIRAHVFGRFRDLLGAVAHHPAMLFYLDNWLSAADGSPGVGKNAGTPAGLNENYGRELLELHTLGVDGGYTQGDVREAARAFTGWSIEKPNEEALFVFRPRRHDAGAKTVLGKSIVAGGEGDGEAVLDLLARQPATAKFIARKLCAKLVADEPEATLVDRVADVFLQSDGDLTATYEAIVFSDEMWSDANDGNKTKTPLEVAASAARAVGAKVAVDTNLPRWIARMGEPLYRAQPPTGYKEAASAWVSAGALVERIDFGLALAADRVKGVSFDPERLVGGSPPADAAQLVDRLAGVVVPRPLASSTRDTIVAQLEASNRGVAYQEASPTLLPQALGLLLGSPEFQKQ